MTIIGYMRVSTTHQKFDSQQRALEKYGVDKVFKEHESGINNNRNELNKALNSLQRGDTFVIFKLDRLARSTKHLLSILEQFEHHQINFVSIHDHIDTSSPMGKFFFTVMGAFAEMEAEVTRQRVIAGLQAAKDNGTVLGRPNCQKKADKAVDLYLTTDMKVADIAETCDISVPTLYNYLKYYEIEKKHR